MGDYIYALIKGENPENPRKEVDDSVVMKLAVEDLKGYYIEAVTAQPGQGNLSSNALKEWFWENTVAGDIVLELIKVCSKSEDQRIKKTGSYFLAPFDIVKKRSDIKLER